MEQPMTDIDLGPYAGDPRIVAETTYVSVPGRDATIITGNEGRTWWVRINGENAFSGKLIKVLEDLLGDPMRVGPTGMREWLHTDGRTYRHDPATTAMVDAAQLRPGDIVDFPHLDAFVILGEKINTRSLLGEWHMAHPVRRINTDLEATFSPRSGDMVPIRFAR
jgi:hypothetical protein